MIIEAPDDIPAITLATFAAHACCTLEMSDDMKRVTLIKNGTHDRPQQLKRACHHLRLVHSRERT